ncbi:uncharacterized protein LOC144914980 isoform X1 [Branchiostoma floridae x Branchiostoma belcheri]
MVAGSVREPPVRSQNEVRKGPQLRSLPQGLLPTALSLVDSPRDAVQYRVRPGVCVRDRWVAPPALKTPEQLVEIVSLGLPVDFGVQAGDYPVQATDAAAEFAFLVTEVGVHLFQSVAGVHLPHFPSVSGPGIHPGGLGLPPFPTTASRLPLGRSRGLEGCRLRLNPTRLMSRHRVARLLPFCVVSFWKLCWKIGWNSSLGYRPLCGLAVRARNEASVRRRSYKKLRVRCRRYTAGSLQCRHAWARNWVFVRPELFTAMIARQSSQARAQGAVHTRCKVFDQVGFRVLLLYPTGLFVEINSCQKNNSCVGCTDFQLSQIVLA